MAASPATMVAILQAALESQPAGIVSVRFADGRSVQYDRHALINELAYWQRLVDAQAGSGLQMTQMSLRGEA